MFIGRVPESHFAFSLKSQSGSGRSLQSWLRASAKDFRCHPSRKTRPLLLPMNFGKIKSRATYRNIFAGFVKRIGVLNPRVFGYAKGLTRF